MRTLIAIVLFALIGAAQAQEEDKIELDTTVIKGNTELPKILYVVPWQDISEDKTSTQKLTLHSLFGDLFEPQAPPSPRQIEGEQ